MRKAAIEFISDKGQVKKCCAKIQRKESVGTVVWEERVHTKPLLKARFVGEGAMSYVLGSHWITGTEREGGQRQAGWEGAPAVKVPLARERMIW